MSVWNYFTRWEGAPYMQNENTYFFRADVPTEELEPQDVCEELNRMEADLARMREALESILSWAELSDEDVGGILRIAKDALAERAQSAEAQKEQG